MPDIFLSYNREDQATARRFAEAFAAEGLDVWWDTTLRAGEAYDEVTETALRTAKAVVVLWSPRSVVSRWVRAEATLADRNKTLLPVTIEPCERPIMFELTQTADLTGWDGGAKDRAWLAFLADVRRFVGTGRGASAPAAAQPSAEPQPDRLSICVLPFANMSRDDEQEYFADGISEDIITDLSKVSALFVIARNTAFTFKGKSVEVPQVARQLNVSHVLEGSVRRAGNRVRITAQLIDGASGGHVWAERWDRDLDDIFALQDEISQAIVGALRLKLLPEEKAAIENRGTANLEAYDLYLRAQSISRQSDADAAQRAIALYREAAALDEGFSMAWLRLALACANALIVAPGVDDWRRLGDEAFERAIASAPDAPMIHALRGSQLFLGRQDWVGAGRAFGRAIELSPAQLVAVVTDNSNVGFPFFLASVGRMTEAVDYYRMAVKADPLATHQMFQFALDCAGRFDEAEADYQRAEALEIDTSIAAYFSLLRCMARDEPARVKERFRRLRAVGEAFLPVYGEILDRFDDRPAVVERLRGAFADALYQDPSRLNGIASMAAYFGDDELALAGLRKAFVEQHGVQVSGIWHPLFASARKTEAFKAMVRELRLFDYWRASGHWGDFARPVGDDDFEIYR
jgi:TolB-like protein